MEKIIPSKQEKNLKLSINNMKRVLFIKAASGAHCYTHTGLVCCKLLHYNFHPATSPALCADKQHILWTELVAQCGSGFIHQDYSTVNEEWNQNFRSA